MIHVIRTNQCNKERYAVQEHRVRAYNIKIKIASLWGGVVGV